MGFPSSISFKNFQIANSFNSRINNKTAPQFQIIFIVPLKWTVDKLISKASQIEFQTGCFFSQPICSC